MAQGDTAKSSRIFCWLVITRSPVSSMMTKRLDGSTVMGLPVLGGEKQLRIAADEGNAGIALGVGDNQIRQKLFVRCQSWGVEVISAIHPTAAVSKSANVKQGTVVMAGAVINPCALIGLAVIVNSGTVIEHDVFINKMEVFGNMCLVKYVVVGLVHKQRILVFKIGLLLAKRKKKCKIVCIPLSGSVYHPLAPIDNQ